MDNELVRDIPLALLRSLAKLEAKKIRQRTLCGIRHGQRAGRSLRTSLCMGFLGGWKRHHQDGEDLRLWCWNSAKDQEGSVMKAIKQDPSDWQAGYDAGLAGHYYVCPADVRDQLAWNSGYIEGHAAKQSSAAEAKN
jgi:hypothetical protein